MREGDLSGHVSLVEAIERERRRIHWHGSRLKARG
jgi:hypothetical protein